GGGIGGGGFGGGGPPMADMGKRLREVERKLDMLIQMMSKQGGGRPGVPGQPPSAVPPGPGYSPYPATPKSVPPQGGTAPAGLVPVAPATGVTPATRPAGAFT